MKRDKLKRRELRAILSLDNRGDNCVLSTRGSQTKRQPHVEPLLVVYRPLIQDHTKALHSIQLEGCCCVCDSISHMHFVIVPPSNKELQRLLRLK